jgi:hypothetical protein
MSLKMKQLIKEYETIRIIPYPMKIRNILTGAARKIAADAVTGYNFAGGGEQLVDAMQDAVLEYFKNYRKYY